MKRRLLLACLSALASLNAQAASEVIALQHRAGAELLPAAQAALGREGTVSVFEDKLIVNASPERIEDVRALLRQLDTRARRLLISVDTDDVQSQDRRGSARIIEYGTGNREGGFQQVQTSEGQTALIQVGQSVPITTGTATPYGAQTNTEYRNVTQGFYVTPSVSGNTVHLKISTNHDHISRERQDVVDVQSSDTTLSGPLGEWLYLGGSSGQSQYRSADSAYTYSTQRNRDVSLRVKVDLVP